MKHNKSSVAGIDQAPDDALSEQLFSTQARLRDWHTVPVWSSPSNEAGNPIHEPPCDENVFRDTDPINHSPSVSGGRLSPGQREVVHLLRRMRAEDAAACMVTHLNDVERPISAEVAGSLIGQLVAAVASVFPEGAEIIGRIATDARMAHIKNDGATQRMRSDHRRALGALQHATPHSDGERAWLLSNHLRDAAEPLTCAPAAGEERRAAGLAALEWARRDEALADLPDNDLLAILERFARPRQSQFGMGGCIEGGLSAQDEAHLVRNILGLTANSDAALGKAMARAKNARLAHFNVCAPRDTRCPEQRSGGERMMTACESPRRQSSDGSPRRPFVDTASPQSRRRSG
jgi:hypothetical protein